MSGGTVAGRSLYGVAWALSAAVLLGGGFVAFAVLGAVIALSRAGPGAAAGVANAFGIYAVVVLLKGLLPALARALLVWARVDRAARLRDRGRIAAALGLLVAATLGSVAAAGLLLPLPTRVLGSVHYTGVGNFLRTCAEMAVPVALSLWIPRALLPASRRGLVLVLTGIAAVFVAGGASIAHFARPSEPPVDTTPPAAAQPPAQAPESSAEGAVAGEAIPQTPIDPAGAGAQNSDGPQSSELGWEEIQRRQQMAERIRKLIAAGPDAAGPPMASGLLAEGSPVPVYRDGALAGVALQNVPPDGFYARLGLREGDVVASINGVPFDAPDVGGALLGALLGSSEVQLTVERDGAEQQLPVSRESLLAGLSELEAATE